MLARQRRPLQVTIEDSRVIPAPVGTVWEWSTDPAHAAAMLSTVVEAHTTAGTPGQVGHTWVQLEKLPTGGQTVIEQTVIDATPGRRQVSVAVEDGARLTLTLTVREARLAEQLPGVAGEQTWVGLHLDAVKERPGLVASLLRGWVAGSVRRMGAESFARELGELAAFAQRDGRAADADEGT